MIDDFYEENPNPDQNEVPKIVADNLKFLTRNAHWNVISWNRGDSITWTFLVESFNGDVPLIMHAVEKKSVRLVEAEKAELRNNKLGKGLLVNGYIIFVVIAFLFFNTQNFDTFNKILYTILFGFYLWFGLLVYKVGEYFKYFFK